MERVDTIVIGAGVVGLAVARACAERGYETLVLEGAAAIGTGTSSRNSEVIHAGLYYPSGSLKARLCVRGKQLLYAYCEARGIEHRRCGKLVVATHEAHAAKLAALLAQGQANGVDDLLLLSATEAQAMEPALHCTHALHSPSTGIVDSHGLMLALQGDLERAGGTVALASPVERVVCGRDGLVVQAAGIEVAARHVINAAGLQAPALAARIEGLSPQHVARAYFAKGSYYALSGKAPFSRLVYPVPEAAGLGVHLTLDLGGQARFGPDVEWIEPAPDGSLDYRVDPARAEGFYAEIRRYWPALPDGALEPAYSGVRPKIQALGGAAQDFVIQGAAEHGIAGLVNLFGIESPGLTAALALGDEVATQLA